MSSLKDAKEIITSLGYNVRAAILGPPADAKARSERLSPTLVPPPAPSPAVAVRRPQSRATSMTSNVQTKLGIEKFLEGTDRFAAISIPDEDVPPDNDVEILGTRRKQTHTKTASSTRSPRTVNSKPRLRNHRDVSPEEARLLGIPVYGRASLQEQYGFDPDRRIPDDAVPIDMGKRVSMYVPCSGLVADFALPTPAFTSRPLRGRRSGGVQPGIDTLTVKSRSDLLQETTKDVRERKNVLPSRINLQHSPSDRHYQDTESPALKKQKPNSPLRLRSDSPSLNSSPLKQSGPSNSSHDGRVSRHFRKNSQAGKPPSPKQPVHVNGAVRVKSTPLRTIASEITSTHRDDEKQHSSDDLMDSHEQPGTFTRNAKQHRLTETRSPAASVQSVGRRPLNDVTSAYRPPDQEETEEPTTHVSQQTIKTTTPRHSRMERRLLEGSPDELSHVVDTPGINSTRKRTVLSPTDYRKRSTDRFDLRHFICKDFVNAPAYFVEIDQKDRTFSISYGNQCLSRDALAANKPIKKIRRIEIPEHRGLSIMILHLSADVLPANTCYLDFKTDDDMTAFHDVVTRLDLTITSRRRPNSYMADAMLNACTEMKDDKATGTNPLPNNTAGREHAHSNPHGGEPRPRRRLTDMLDVPEPVKKNQNRIDSGPDPLERGDSPKILRSEQQREQPITYGIRQTRSRPSVVGSNPEEAASDPKLTKVQRLQTPPWDKPLLYPLGGIRAAQVGWDDLSGLEDGEFLNDSIVTFFLRYLQEHGNPDHVKRMHFFSTFFYETMTRSPGKVSINYKSVEKWTKSVNIFNRDFVVVPVNESLHWFVLIICNLKRLFSDEDQGEGEADEVGVEEAEQITHEEAQDHSRTRGDDDQIVIGDGGLSPQLVDDRGSNEEDGTGDRKKKKAPGRRKQAPRPQRKYDPDLPIIITLDSLGVSRSGQASKVKDYLVQEAKEKLQLDIDKGAIQGMTAKDIPQQNNFVDCGLYLCVYLERFMQDPYKFVKSILQRDKEGLKWPQRPRSSMLRDRLYDLLQNLHSAQQEKKRVDDSPLGNILIKSEDYNTPEHRPKVKPASAKDKEEMGRCLDYADEYLAQGNQAAKSASERVRLAIPDAAENPTSQGEDPNILTTKAQFFQQERGPITIEDESQEQPQPRLATSKYFDGNPIAHTVLDPPLPQDEPQRLAQRLRKARSPSQQQNPAGVEIITVLNTPTPASTPLREQNLANYETKSAKRHQRTGSVTTEFLTSDESYHSAPSHTPLSNQQPTHPNLATVHVESSFEGLSDRDYDGDEDMQLPIDRQLTQDGDIVIEESVHGDDEQLMQMDVDNDADEMMIDH